MDSKALYSSAPAKGWLPWSALAPFLLIVFVAVTQIAGSSVLERLGIADAKGDPVGLTGLFAFLLFPFALTGLVVLAWVRFVERRPLATIGLVGSDGSGRFLRGVGVGILMIVALVAAIWIAGGLTADGVGKAFASPRSLVSIGFLLVCFAVQSSVEEIIFRGWLLSGVARRSNVVVAVVITCLVFTFLHYGRHQPWLVTLSSFMFSLFTCCWALRAGNIWGVMGWHAGWNWLLAVGFELPVTGLRVDLPALLVRMVPRGPDQLTGGAQGPEGSLPCILLFAGASAFLMWSLRRGRAGTSTSARENAAEVG